MNPVNENGRQNKHSSFSLRYKNTTMSPAFFSLYFFFYSILPNSLYHSQREQGLECAAKVSNTSQANCVYHL